MAYTFPWDESFPPGTQTADQLNEDLQRILVQTRERLVDILGIVFPNDTVTTATASKLVLKGSATSKIIPGATSHSIRNNADNADNLLIADNGLSTFRATVVISSGNPLVLDGASGTQRLVKMTTGGLTRWLVQATNTAESGGNAGSNFAITRFDDSGAQIDSPIQITRSTGLVTIASGLTISSGGITVTGTSAFAGGFQVSFSGSIVVSGSTVIIDGAAGIKRTIRYTTSGSLRWEAQTTNTAESGANAGSDYALSAYDDSGAFITNALQITRSNRLATFGGDVTITHGAGPSFLNLSNAAGQDRRIKFQSSGVDRFTIGIGSGAEGGSNTGSDILFRVMDDAGATIADFLTVVRATGISTFSRQVVISNNNAATLEVKKDASVDNRYIRLTDTEASGQQWDLIQRSVAAGSHFLIFNVTGNIIAVQITPSGSVTIGSQSTASIGLIVDRNVAAGNNGIIQLSRQGSTKGFIGLDASDNFVIFNSGGTGIVTVSTTVVSGPIFDAVTGFRIGGAAGGGKYLRGDGTNFVSSSIQQADLPTYESVRTYKSAATQTLSAVAGTLSAITFDAEDYDTNNLHDNVTNNSRLTAPTAGKYRITAHIAFTGITSNVAASIRKNGVATELAETFLTVTSTSIGTVEVNVTLSLAATDYVEIYCKSDQANHTILNNQERTYFEMIKVTI